jgi:hypothetical protein
MGIETLARKRQRSCGQNKTGRLVSGRSIGPLISLESMGRRQPPNSVRDQRWARC